MHAWCRRRQGWLSGHLLTLIPIFSYWSFGVLGNKAWSQELTVPPVVGEAADGEAVGAAGDTPTEGFASTEPPRLPPLNMTQAMSLPGPSLPGPLKALFPPGSLKMTQAVSSTGPTIGQVVTVAFLEALQSPPSGDSSPPASESQASMEDLKSVEAEVTAILKVETVAGLRAETEQRTDLDEAVKAQILAHCDKAASLLQQRADAEQKLLKWKAERDNAPATIAELKAELEKPAPSSDPEYSAEASLTELDQLRLADQERLEEAKKSLEAWEVRAQTRAERRPQMPSLIETTRSQCEETRKTLGMPPTEGETPQLAQARRIEQQAQYACLSAQLELYLMEQLRYEALHELFPLQRDQLTRNRNALERRSERWKEVLTQARLKESERQRLEARKRLELAHPALRDLAVRNSWLTQYRQEHLQLKNAWRTEQAAINTTLESLRQKFKEVQDRVERVGLTTAIGLTLRNQKTSLPSASHYRREQREAVEEFERLQSEQLQFDDERRALDDLDGRIDQIVSIMDSSGISQDELSKMTRELLVLQREYLEAILSDLESSLTMLVDTEFSCRQLTQLIHQYDDYIDQRVLWIRSVPALRWTTAEQSMRDIRELMQPSMWASIVDFAVRDVRQQPSLYAIVLLLAAGTFLGGRQLARIIVHPDHRMFNPLNAEVQRITKVLLSIVLLSAAGPGVMGFVAWRLNSSEIVLGQALASGLLHAAALLWSLTIVRWIVRRQGVAESLWLWPESVLRSFRKSLTAYALGGIPLCILFSVASRLEGGTSAESVGRIAFVLYCVLISCVLAYSMNPQGVVVGTWLRSRSESLVYKTRWLWFPIAVTAPLGMAMLAILGYLYTAEQLMFRLELTLGLMMLLVIVGTVVNRWLLAARRRLAIQQAKLKREAELASSSDGFSSDLAITVEPERLDLTAVNRQVMRFVQLVSVGLLLSGCWVIWDQVFPALQVFTRVEVWSSITTVAEVVETPTGPQVQESSRLQPITREHLIIAIAVFTVCILASRNVPGLLELSALQRLPLDSGSRNAVKLLTGYAFVAAGIAISTNLIGLRWSSVQWLVAALTVGLGFGLQEIFANFVSGLIILFERPVRIGDVVTIDSVTGTVTRIRSRATTITDWDRKEFIVPNKEFVTGRLLNWTLSDRMTRVLVNVGVAYETDVRLALELMKQVADSHPMVLKDPAPIATFEEFGESSLNLVLRSYLPSLDCRLQVLTELNTAINDQFRSAGIQIALPQRDLHIRSIQPQAQEATAGLHLPPAISLPTELGQENLPDGHSRQDEYYHHYKRDAA